MSRGPTLEQKLDALHSPESLQKRAKEAREKQRAKWAAEGWSPWAIAQGHDGPIDCYKETQRPWGVEPPYSDRKSKRKRSSRKILMDAYAHLYGQV